MDKIDPTRPYSLSYGTGLFAGAIHDGGATAFHYMRSFPNAYAIAVPFSQLHRSPFYIPPTNTLAQLFGHGGIFHGRTKAWEGIDLKQLEGMKLWVNFHKRQRLASSLSKQEFVSQFERYKQNAIPLKP